MRKINVGNPLWRHRAKQMHLEWDEYAKKYNVPVTTLRETAFKSKEQLKNITLNTYLLIKDKIGIDLIKDYDEQITIQQFREKLEQGRGQGDSGGDGSLDPTAD